MKKKNEEDEEIENSLLNMAYGTYCLCNTVIMCLLSKLDMGEETIPVRQAYDILLSAWNQRSEGAANLRIVSHDLRYIDGVPTIVVNWNEKKSESEYVPLTKFDACLLQAKDHRKSIFLVDEDQLYNMKLPLALVFEYAKDDMVHLGTVVGALLCSMVRFDENAEPAECVAVVMGKNALLEIVPNTRRGAGKPQRKEGGR